MGNLAIYFLLLHVRQPARWKAGLSFICFAAGLLTREESLVYVAMIPLIGLVYEGQQRGTTDRPIDLIRWVRQQLSSRSSNARLIALHFAALLMISAVFWLWRARLVSGGTPLHPGGIVDHLLWTFLPRIPFGSVLIWLLSMVVFYVGLVLMTRVMMARRRTLALLWLVCIVIASTPGLIVPRPNKIQLPILFFGLFLAQIMGDFARTSRLAAVASTVILIWFITGSILWHKTAQLALNPNSTDFVEGNISYLWGEWSSAAAFIPPERAAQAVEHLKALGIDSQAEYEAALAQLQAAGQPLPSGIFVAPHPFLSAY
jgi:hypothetical protein